MKFRPEGLLLLGSVIFLGIALDVGLLAVGLLPSEGPRPTVPSARQIR